MRFLSNSCTAQHILWTFPVLFPRDIIWMYSTAVTLYENDLVTDLSRVWVILMELNNRPLAQSRFAQRSTDIMRYRCTIVRSILRRAQTLWRMSRFLNQREWFSASSLLPLNGSLLSTLSTEVSCKEESTRRFLNPTFNAAMKLIVEPDRFQGIVRYKRTSWLLTTYIENCEILLSTARRTVASDA